MSENTYAIPLTTGAQQFTIKLGENALQIRLVWREAQGGGWFMDLSGTDGTQVLAGLALRCGHDLLEEHAYLGLGKLTVFLDGKSDSDPIYDDMGRQIQLIWSPS